jgi:membrane protease YdiL (CAAX protease family)
MQQHQGLELITVHSQLPLRILIVVLAVVLAPVLEEMLFRGLFQTMIRPFFSKPWLSIVISSGLFAAFHQQPGHWPALFMLGMCLGYSYEKSGSLFRPIFIHSFFNGIAITAALYQ